MTRRLASVGALLALLAACAGDPASPSATGSRPTLRLDLLLQNGDLPSDVPREALITYGWFGVGRDSTGRPRRLLAPARFGDSVLVFTPTATDPTSGMMQERRLALPAAVFGHAPLTLELPQVEGVAPPVARLELSSLRRESNDTVRADSSGFLRMRVAIGAAAEPTAGPRYTRRWQLAVTPLGATQPGTLTYAGSGLPPRELLVARDLLPPTPQRQWWISITLTEEYGENFTDAHPFGVAVNATSRIWWLAVGE